MIKHLKHSEIDKNKWDECIQRADNGLIYAYSWYLDLVCNSWDALVEDDYQSVFPLTFNKKFNIHYLYQPFFAQQLGVFSQKILTTENVEEFLKLIPSRFRLIEINLNTQNKITNPAIPLKSSLTHELPLNDSYDILKNEYSTNLKRNIKKAIAAGVEIRNNQSMKSIIEIFRNNKGKSISTFSDKEYFILEKLINTCDSKGLATVLGAYENNKLCAGASFIESNNKVIFLFSATNKQAFENGAMSLLINTFIKEHAQSNLTLDFEGSNNPDLARFYKGFGAKEKIYFQYYKNTLKQPLSFGLTMYKKAKN